MGSTVGPRAIRRSGVIGGVDPSVDGGVDPCDLRVEQVDGVDPYGAGDGLRDAHRCGSTELSIPGATHHPERPRQHLAGPPQTIPTGGVTVSLKTPESSPGSATVPSVGSERSG